MLDHFTHHDPATLTYLFTTWVLYLIAIYTGCLVIKMFTVLRLIFVKQNSQLI